MEFLIIYYKVSEIYKYDMFNRYKLFKREFNSTFLHAQAETELANISSSAIYCEEELIGNLSFNCEAKYGKNVRSLNIFVWQTNVSIWLELGMDGLCR